MKRVKLFQKMGFEIEEIILFIIIILNFLDVFEIIGSDLDYVKKLISWSALGILVYKTSPSKLFVGFRRKKLDIILIIAYFLMILKNLISYAYVSITTASDFLHPLFEFLILNAKTIEIGGLYIGFFLMVVVCFNLVLLTPLKAPSILHLMRADHIKHDGKTFLKHFFSLLFISLGFFLIFFNLIMEWLAIAIDAPLLMIGLLTYFIVVIKHKNKFSPGSFLRKFGDFGGDFYEGILKHLRFKRTFLRVVSSMLILHILTDMLTFLWRYIFGIADPLYLNLLGFHPTLFQLISKDVSVSLFSSLIHIGNFIGILFLMISPIIIWFKIYFNKKLIINKQIIFVIFFGLLTLILNPTFNMTALKNKAIYGVDISGVSAYSHQILSFSAVLIIVLLCTLLISRLSIPKLKFILIIVSEIFFSMYVFLYFYSISFYYINVIPQLMSYNWFLSGLFAIFFLITILFYILSLGTFLIDSTQYLKEKIKS